MAQAVAKVASAVSMWGDDKIRRKLRNTAQTYYSGAMLCRDTGGYAVKATDTTGLVFDGINARSGDLVVPSGEADGDRELIIKRPWRITMAIASAVLGDEGKKVYVVDDQTVGYTSSNSVLVGWVDKVLSATSVLITPIWSPLNPVTVSGNVLSFTGTTGVDQITFPDNLADALTFAQGTANYMTFVTTDGSELTKVLGPAATAVTNTGGGVQVTGGIGGATSGAGGTVVIAGGAGTNGNAAGGLVSNTGGAGQGSAAGGASSVVGGAGGATGVGGAAVITGGAGGASSGTGGAATIAGGAGTAGNAAGGVASLTGGAGQGSAAGGIGKTVGGAGGATGAGGAAQLTGGAGGATSGTGGAATITAGAGTGTTAAGGAASITGGASPGASGTAGAASIDAGAAAGGTGATVNISDVNATATYLNRGPLKALQIGVTLTSLGTTQSSTPTSAQLLGGLVTQTGATGAGTVTLPTGTALSTACARTPVVGDSFDVWFINVGGGQTLTITGATGTTVSGTVAVPSAKFALMKFYNTGANTWNIYCLLSA